MESNQKPYWWLEKGSPFDLTPDESLPTFEEARVYEEYLERGMDDVMSFPVYKDARKEVINIIT